MKITFDSTAALGRPDRKATQQLIRDRQAQKPAGQDGESVALCQPGLCTVPPA